LGPIGRRGAAAGTGPSGVIARLNSGALTPFPPAGRVTSLEDVGESFYPRWLPRWVRPYLRSAFLLLLLLGALVLVASLVVGVVLGWWPWAAVVAAAVGAPLVVIAVAIRPDQPRVRTAERLRIDALTPEAVAAAPPAPDFRAAEPGGTPPATVAGTPGTDSPEAVRFRTATTDAAAALRARGGQPVQLEALDIGGMATTIVARLDPELTVPARIGNRVRVAIGEVVEWDNRGAPLAQIMAAPEFPQPMYEPLRDLS